MSGSSTSANPMPGRCARGVSRSRIFRRGKVTPSGVQFCTYDSSPSRTRTIGCYRLVGQRLRESACGRHCKIRCSIVTHGAAPGRKPCPRRRGVADSAGRRPPSGIGPDRPGWTLRLRQPAARASGCSRVTFAPDGAWKRSWGIVAACRSAAGWVQKQGFNPGVPK